MSSEKPQLRSLMRSQRQALQPQQRHQAALDLTQHFLTHPLFLSKQKFAFYLAINGEMDTEPLLTHCLNAGKNCYLPILPVKPSKQLCFVEFQKHDVLNSNRLGIKEPLYVQQKVISPQDLDVILLPLVAFDNAGNRLGMGAGYYDNTFAFLQQQQPTLKTQPLLLGVAYNFQAVAKLPHDPWDIPLDGVITESGVRLFAP